MVEGIIESLMKTVLTEENYVLQEMCIHYKSIFIYFTSMLSTPVLTEHCVRLEGHSEGPLRGSYEQ